MHTREGDTVYGDLYYRELVSYSELKDLSDGYIVTTNGTKLRIMNLLETISFLDPSNQLTTDQYKEMVSDYSSMFEYSFYNEVTKNLYVLSNAKEGYYALINFETGFELMFLIDSGIALTVEPSAIITILAVKDDTIVEQSMSGDDFNKANFPIYSINSSDLPAIESLFGKVDLSEDTSSITSFTQKLNVP